MTRTKKRRVIASNWSSLPSLMSQFWKANGKSAVPLPLFFSPNFRPICPSNIFPLYIYFYLGQSMYFPSFSLIPFPQIRFFEKVKLNWKNSQPQHSQKSSFISSPQICVGYKKARMDGWIWKGQTVGMRKKSEE